MPAVDIGDGEKKPTPSTPGKNDPSSKGPSNRIDKERTPPGSNGTALRTQKQSQQGPSFSQKKQDELIENLCEAEAIGWENTVALIGGVAGAGVVMKAGKEVVQALGVGAMVYGLEGKNVVKEFFKDRCVRGARETLRLGEFSKRERGG